MVSGVSRIAAISAPWGCASSGGSAPGVANAYASRGGRRGITAGTTFRVHFVVPRWCKVSAGILPGPAGLRDAPPVPIDQAAGAEQLALARRQVVARPHGAAVDPDLDLAPLGPRAEQRAHAVELEAGAALDAVVVGGIAERQRE